MEESDDIDSDCLLPTGGWCTIIRAMREEVNFVSSIALLHNFSSAFLTNVAEGDLCKYCLRIHLGEEHHSPHHVWSPLSWSTQRKQGSRHGLPPASTHQIVIYSEHDP